MREVKDDGRESDCRWTSDNSAFKRSSRMTPRSEWYRGQSTWDAEKDNGVVDERRLSLCWILKKNSASDILRTFKGSSAKTADVGWRMSIC